MERDRASPAAYLEVHRSSSKSSDDPSAPRDWGGLELTYPDRLVAPPAWMGHTPFALWMVEALKPRMIVELGVHSGNSYCTFLQAVRALSLPTRCFGIDHWRGDEHAGNYGEEVFAELRAYHDPLYGDFSTLIRSTFQDALAYFSDDSIDLLHIDGLHTYEAVRDDFTNWLPKMSAGGVVLFHDINVREPKFGVWQLWQEISLRYPHFEFTHASGLGAAYVGREPLPAVLTGMFGVPSDAVIVHVRGYFARLGVSVSERFSSREAKARAATAETELQVTRNEASRLTAEMAAQQGELSRVRAETAGQLEAAGAAAAAHQGESERAHAHIAHLQAKLHASQAEMTRELEATRTAAAAHQAESESLQGHVMHLKGQLLAGQAEITRQIETARDVASDHQSELEAFAAGARRMRARVQILESKLAASTTSGRSAASKVAELERALTAARATLSKAASERDDAKGKLADAAAQRDSARHIIRQQTAVVGRLQRELLTIQSSRMSQRLVALAFARINPRMKRAIPHRVRIFVKRLLLGVG